MDRPAFVRLMKELGFDLSEAQLLAFATFEEALYRANEVANLTRVPREECFIRHFLDSLLFAEFIPMGATVLDIGTGPGLPAWPLACARPDLKVAGLDSSGKMIGFLRSQPLPNLSAIQGRAEEGKAVWGEFDFVTGRALAPLAIQLELSALHCAKGGYVVPARTAADLENFKNPALSKLGLKLERVEIRPLPGTEILRYFPIYLKKGTGIRARSWAEMRRLPLFD